jgi:hypothetical protein
VFTPSLVVYVNNVTVSDWELEEDTGLLKFHVPPQPRSKITGMGQDILLPSS